MNRWLVKRVNGGEGALYATGVLRMVDHPNVIRTVDQFKGEEGPISILELCVFGSLE